MTYVVRGSRVHAQADAVRQAVWGLNPDLPVAAIQTMQDVVERSVTQFSFTMLTLAIAAGIARAWRDRALRGPRMVTLRTREIGVRMALGARPAVVKRRILANAAAITATGLVIGALGAAVLTQFLGGLLYETKPIDALTFAGMADSCGGFGRRVSAGAQGGFRRLLEAGDGIAGDRSGVRSGGPDCRIPTTGRRIPVVTLPSTRADRCVRRGAQGARRRWH